MSIDKALDAKEDEVQKQTDTDIDKVENVTTTSSKAPLIVEEKELL